MVLAASYQVLLIPREIDVSNSTAMSRKQVNLLCEEVTDLTLSHILVLCSVQEHTVVEGHRLDAVNYVIRRIYLLVFNTLHLLSLILIKLFVLFLSFTDRWHCVVIKLPLLLARSFDVDDSYLALN